jgi:hypothetical protein
MIGMCRAIPTICQDIHPERFLPNRTSRPRIGVSPERKNFCPMKKILLPSENVFRIFRRVLSFWKKPIKAGSDLFLPRVPHCPKTEVFHELSDFRDPDLPSPKDRLEPSKHQN